MQAWAQLPALVAASTSHTLSLSYSSDGTPALVKKSFASKVDGLAVYRHARSGLEYIMQRMFLVYHDAVGARHQRCIVAEPLPMSKGKQASHNLAFYNDFFLRCGVLAQLESASDIV